MRARRFRRSVVRPLLALAVGLLLGGATSAAPVAYTDVADFLAALPGPAATAGFDGLASGTVIPSGGSAGGITFTYDFGGLDLLVTDGTAAGGGGPFDTTSPPNFLGTSDADLLIDGDDLALGFAPANAVGLFIITAELPGSTLFDDDLRLGASGGTAFLDVDAVQETLPDGSLVFFLGVIDPAASFTTANLDNCAVCGGFFTYNVDDVVTAVPEPDATLLVRLSLAVLASLGLVRSRSASTLGARRSS